MPEFPPRSIFSRPSQGWRCARWLVIGGILGGLSAFGAAPAMSSARAMAETLSRQLTGTRIVAVQANGNLQPVFEADAFLVVEPTSPEALHVGDMVTYEHPKLHTTVVQRLLKVGDIAVGPETELTRVLAVIYDRKGAGSPSLATAVARTPTPAVMASVAATGGL